MLDFETIKKLLEDRNVKLVASRIGVHSNTLYQCLNGHNKPNYNTLKKLSDYFENEKRIISNG